LVISPACVALIKAFEEGYHYPRHRVIGTSEYVYSDKPAKNDASHVADALQYGCLHVSGQGKLDSRDMAAIKQAVAKRNAYRRVLTPGGGNRHV
jgi:hypothetical protein